MIAMLIKYEILNKINQEKLVAVIRGRTKEEAIEISKAAIAGGIKIIEVTYTTDGATDVIKGLKNLKDAGVTIGAGTVLDSETARTAILNGVDFIVGPHYDKDIKKLCNRYSVPYLPGCLTIKEMVKALEGGCEVVKLFPANNFKASFVQSVHGPLPQIQLMPTGGVNINNFKDWLDAGAFAIGIGSDLTKAYAQDGYKEVVKRSKEYVLKLKN